MIRLGLRLTRRRRPGGGRPAGADRGRGRDRRRPAADDARRHQRGQRPERPLRLAGDRIRRRTAQRGARRRAIRCGGSLRADYFQGELIGRVDLAATGPDSPVPPGIAALPGPGQYYASPALAKLLRADPGRASSPTAIPGTLVGTIGAAALPAPELADHHRRPHRRRPVAPTPTPQLVTDISTTVPSSCDGLRYRRRHRRQRHRR